MIAWDLNSKNSSSQLSGPHKNPILDFAWHNSLVVSGDKAGFVALWDINKAEAFYTLRAHHGPVANILLYSNGLSHNLICTAGVEDGLLNIMDMRTNEKVFCQQIHSRSINGICSNAKGNRNLLFY